MDAHHAYLVLVGLLAAQRLAELGYARRTARVLQSRGAVAIRPDGMRGIVAVHVLFFVGILAESRWAPWSGTTTLAAGILLFAAGELLRTWSMVTLGERWSTRVFVVPGVALVAGGPYRFLRHPIYVGVTLELAGFALISSLWLTALTVTGLNLLALRRRMAIEETANRTDPDRPTHVANAR